jgi:WD40 repeat protein
VKLRQKQRSTQQKVAHSFPSPWTIPPNKIFSSAWLDHDRILIGCKDNTLWEISVAKLPWVIRSIELPQTHLNPQDQSGNRTIKVNPTSLVFASGSSDSKRISIMSSEKLEHVQMVQGHNHSILDCEWLSDSRLVTVGRGGEMKVHSCFSATEPSSVAAIVSEYLHPQEPEFRCVKRMPKRQKFLVASMEGEMQLFDSTRLSLVQGISLANQHSIRAIDYNYFSGAFLVASDGIINCYDARNNQSWAKIHFPDYRNIRSLSSDQNLITLATGSGKIAFCDIRTLSIVPMDDHHVSHWMADPTIQSSGTPILTTGKNFYRLFGGHVVPTDFYNGTFAPHPVEQGIFTHCYDPSGIRLFVGGGPSLASLDGCNLAILH